MNQMTKNYLLNAKFVVLLGACVFQANAQDIADALYGNEVLRNVKTVAVYVDLDEDFKAYNISIDEIKTDVEIKLMSAGLKVVELMSEGSEGVVRIKIASFQSDINLIAFSLFVEFIEGAIIKRGNQQYLSYASTWVSSGTIGIAGTDKIHQARSSIDAEINEFVNAWLKVNQDEGQ